MKNLKNKIIFLILIILNINAYSQYESVFGTYQTYWNVRLIPFSSTIPFVDSSVYSSDTIINGLTYKNIEVFFNSPDTIFSLSYKSYQVLEDTNQGKYWVYQGAYDGTDELIYDMTLEKGDTFKNSWLNFIVDTVYFNNGRKYISLDYMNSDGVKLEMIEGVGLSFGLIYLSPQIFEAPHGHLLLCQYKDNSLSYVNNHGLYAGYCNIPLGDKEYLNDDFTINLYPNPVDDCLYIDVANVDIELLKIYNINGEIVKYYNTSTTIINTTSFREGCYLLQLETSRGRISKIFIKR